VTGSIVLIVAILAFLAGVVIGRQFHHRRNVGEALVANAIAAGFKRQHVLLNNVTLQNAAASVQIDHLLVADTGIFVIETKHYTGWIFGNPSDRHWTQVIYRFRSKFRNPIHQNYGHMKAVQSLFTLPMEAYFSVVVFTGEAELKSDFGPEVLRLHELIPYLTTNRPAIFDERKIAYVVGRIEMQRMRRSVETDEYHLNSVRRRIDRG